MFSVSWMDFMEQNENQLETKTLEYFYETVKFQVMKSQVQSFGSPSIRQNPIASVFVPSETPPEDSGHALFFSKFLTTDHPDKD